MYDHRVDVSLCLPGRHREVLPTTEVRAKLSQVAGFERRGVSAEPVGFGSHRRQGIIYPLLPDGTTPTRLR